MGAVRSPKRKAPRGAGLGPTWNRAERIQSHVIGGETGIRTLDTFDRILDFECRQMRQNPHE